MAKHCVKNPDEKAGWWREDKEQMLVQRVLDAQRLSQGVRVGYNARLHRQLLLQLWPVLITEPKPRLSWC